MNMEKCIIDRLTDLVYKLETRPAWVEKNNLSFELVGGNLEVHLFGEYVILVTRDLYECSYKVPDNCALGYGDMEYAIEIIDNRNEIMDIVDEWIDLIKDFIEVEEEEEEE